MRSPSPKGNAPLVWLYTAEAERLDALRILADQIADLPSPPAVRVVTEADPDQMHAEAPALLVVAGDTLPLALLEAARARGIARMLIDAGAELKLDRFSLWPGRLKMVLSGFSAIHARNLQASSELRRLLRESLPIETTGALARWPAVASCNVSELAALRGEIGARPVWFAHALPEPEFAAVLRAHAHAMRHAHRLLLIVTPRLPELGQALADQARALGLETSLRSAEGEIGEMVQVYVADTEGEQGLFLRLAGATFLGGSFTQGAPLPSPIEVAALGTPIIYGDPASAGSARARRVAASGGDKGFLDALLRAGAARRLKDPSELGEAVAAYIAPETGAGAALQAWDHATRGSAATWTVACAIRDWLALNHGQG